MNKRHKAFTTLLVSAANAGLASGIIDLDSIEDIDLSACTFVLPNGVLCAATFNGIGYGDISIKVYVNPDRVLTPNCDSEEGVYSFRTGKVGSNAVGCCAIVYGCLDRKNIAVDKAGYFRITRDMLIRISELNVEPCGYTVPQYGYRIRAY